MNIKVIDEDGKWFRNNSEFPMNHHQRGVIMVPGVSYRFNEDAWLKSQPMVEAVEDPLKPAPKAKPKAEAKE